MKVILSRKGFDSKAGGIASPIFENGDMVSLPIPSCDSNSYSDFVYEEMEYSKVLEDLKYKGDSLCHADPDLDQARRKERIRDWVPAFGQCGPAATYLKNIGLKEGDLFLFFGNFHCVRMEDGKLKYVSNTGDFYKDRDIQVIWGYLQVGEILDTAKEQKKLKWHPHADDERTTDPTNIIIKASDTLSFDNSKPGAGILTFDEKRILTKYGCNKATWKMNDVYLPWNIYGNRKNSANDPLFSVYYSGQWQELGLKESDKCTEWARRIISDEDSGNVVLIAECHNWGLITPMDWQESHYVLHKDGTLTITRCVGDEITEVKKTISGKDLAFIQSKIDDYIEADASEACDGVAWKVKCGRKTFELGYVYGTKLEVITDILKKAEETE